jgi:hypothetical protein
MHKSSDDDYGPSLCTSTSPLVTSGIMELFLSVVVGIMVVAVGYGVLQLVRFATGDGDLAVTSATVPDGWWNGKVSPRGVHSWCMPCMRG